MRAGRLLYFLLFFIPFLSDGHPGVGIVVDSRGNIFYTDLKHVWKVGPGGEQAIAVPNVHTHELYIDQDDNLFGEHLWYEGEAIDKWGHYVWCLKNDGPLEKVIPPTEGFLKDYSFVRDNAGNMYWVNRGDTCDFMKKDEQGNITTIARGKFKDVRWMHSTPEGKIYFIDLTDLVSIEPNGSFRTVVRDLDNRSLAFGVFAGDRHNLMGIWTDNNQNIYVASFGGQKVKRVSPDGKTEVISSSSGTWSPSGGVFDKQGKLWLLEYSLTNEAKVRKVELNMRGNVHKDRPNIFLRWILPLTGGIILFSFFILRTKRLRLNTIRNKS